MPTPYEQFREAVLKAASPEHKADSEGIRHGIDINNNYFQLVGRDLTLEDVLRAVGQTKEYKLISHIEENISAIMLAPRRWSSDGQIYIKWFMGKPAHLQSDETLLEIIKILK